MGIIKSTLKKNIIYKAWIDFNRKLNNQNERDDFVVNELKKLPQKSLLLDAGCGSQRYRQYCDALNYRGQDFGQYSQDEKSLIGNVDGYGIGGKDGYKYGKLDYIGDIWNINEADNTFDVVLCTEVFEHIPYPNETIKEFSRLLKIDGKLILTAPSNCLRHMDPYYFYTGFSDRYYEKFLVENGLEIEMIEPVGDYYTWISKELYRTLTSHSFFSKMILIPSFLYYWNKKKTKTSIDSLCEGYHIVAKKVR